MLNGMATENSTSVVSQWWTRAADRPEPTQPLSACQNKIAATHMAKEAVLVVPCPQNNTTLTVWWVK